MRKIFHFLLVTEMVFALYTMKLLDAYKVMILVPFNWWVFLSVDMTISIMVFFSDFRLILTCLPRLCLISR